jgi:hypothetical protein
VYPLPMAEWLDFRSLSNNLGICSLLNGQPQWLFQIGF